MFSRGMTLIELTVVVAGIAILAALSIPVSTGFMKKQILDESAHTVASYIEYARTSALSGEGDVSRGVYVTPEHVVVFEGDAYESRNMSADLEYVFPVGVKAGTTTEIFFEKGTGAGSFPETITLRAGSLNAYVVNNVAGAYVQY